MNPLIFLAWSLAWTVLGSAILLLAAFFVRRIPSASVRHLGLAGAFGCVMLLPIFFAASQMKPGEDKPVCFATWVDWISTYPLSSLLLGGWALGTIWAIVQACWALRQVGQWLKAGEDYQFPAGSAAAPMQAVRARIAARKGMPVPMVAGIFKPVVLLPFEARWWDESRLIAVVLHEAGHIHRRDHLIQLFALVACAAHWFNPFFWFAARRMEAEAEIAADDYAILRGVKPSKYAAELLAMARELGTCKREFPRVSTAMIKKFTLEERLQAVVAHKAERGRAPVKAYAQTTLLLAGSTAALMMLSAQVATYLQPAASPPSCLVAAKSNL